MDADPPNLHPYPDGIAACDQCVIKTVLTVTGYAPGLALKETQNACADRASADENILQRPRSPKHTTFWPHRSPKSAMRDGLEASSRSKWLTPASCRAICTPTLLSAAYRLHSTTQDVFRPEASVVTPRMSYPPSRVAGVTLTSQPKPARSSAITAS